VAGEWEEGDIPAAEHRRHFPRCPFICNLPVGNIPIGLEDSDSEDEAVSRLQEEPESYGFDVCGRFVTFLGSENPCTTLEQVIQSARVIPVTEDSPSSLAVKDSPSSLAVKDSPSLSETTEPKPPGTKEDLEEEIRKLKEARQCKICMDNEVAVVFLPCGHLVSCLRCATALSNCPLCRQPIKAVVRTYLS